MPTVLILNDSHCAINVAGKLIPVGSQRQIDSADVTPGIKQYVVKAGATDRNKAPKKTPPKFSPADFLKNDLRGVEDKIGSFDSDRLKTLKKSEGDNANRNDVLEIIDVALLALSIEQ